MDQLQEGIGSSNGGSGVPSVLGGKRHTSSKKRKRQGDVAVAAAFAELSRSIDKHRKSLVAAAKIAAAEQAKNRTQSRASKIHGRINSLRDRKREMTEPNVINNKLILDDIVHEIEGIEDEIASNTEELNLLMATTTTTNNRGPN